MNFKRIISGCLLLSLFAFYSCKKQAQKINEFSFSGLEPQRIVSLSPAGTEIICALGAFDKLAARTDYCDYPEYVSSVPSVGGFDGKTLSIETILSFNPDFVYAAQRMHEKLLPLLTQEKIPYYLSTANSVDSVYSEIRDIGKILNLSKEAEKLTEKMQDEFKNLEKEYSGQKPVSVYWEIWNPPYMSIGKDSFINQLISMAGGKNIFAEVEQPYPVVSEEQILFSQPEVIIIPSYDEHGIEGVKLRKYWKDLPAVKNNRIYALDADLISRPGPRITEAARLISEKLHE